MYKSLLIASCAVLTFSVFGMDPGEFSEISRTRSNSLSSLVDKQNCSNQGSDLLLEDVVKKQISIVNDLKEKLAEKTQENSELASQNELLTRQLDDVQKTGESSDRPRNEELIRQLVESFQQLNLQSAKSEIKEAEPHKTYEFVDNRLYLFEKIGNTNAYRRHATPTTVEKVSDNWNDISIIRYANDVSYNVLKNPKMIFYRNKDDSCYSILRIGNNKHGVFYGVNANDIEIGENSFSVYDVSREMGSFTNNILRQIYVDKSGLYFVPSAENPLESVIDIYQKEGKFDFKGSILKVSALDGSITFDGQPVTEKNFFDNWVWEKSKTVLSSARPKPREILRNFYPPKGSYEGIYLYLSSINTDWSSGMLLINKRLQAKKELSSQECKNLIENDLFSSMLNRYYGGDQKVCDAIAKQLRARGLTTTDRGGWSYREYTISEMISSYSRLFKDPEFVRSLKPDFAEIEKDYPKTRESDKWLPFEIVRNL